MVLDLTPLVNFLLDARTIWAVLWLGLGLLTVALLLLMRTKWGQARPLAKCVMLSLYAHILLLGYAYMTRLFFEFPPGVEQSVRISVAAPNEPAQQQRNVSPEMLEEMPWRQLVTAPPVEEALPVELVRQQPALELPAERERQLTRPPVETPPPADRLPDDRRDVVLAEPEIETMDQRERTAPGVQAETIEAPRPERREAVEELAPVEPPLAPVPTEEQLAVVAPPPAQPTMPADVQDLAARVQRLADVPLNRQTASAMLARGEWLFDATATADADPSRFNPLRRHDALARSMHHPPFGRVAEGRSGATSRGGDDLIRQRMDGQPLPSIYRFRVAEDRDDVIRRHGGNARTEAAVQLALKWLAESQSADGRWNASQYGAGRETQVGGHDRGGAGAHADTGITGLAVLAFLANGQTHLKGQYRRNVQHGLEFLLRSQARDGSLAGEAGTFAQLYCHGIASIAISEAYAMTGDERLAPFVERALRYTREMQHPTNGGWRYQKGDLGDTSQFGWQLMALKSGEAGGIAIPPSCDRGMRIFLRSVSSGQYGGLASYRANERVTPTMTAEALACRFFLGAPPNDPAAIEAADYLLANLPDDSIPNLYYWYYATLALHQMQDQRWERWNAALQQRLLPLQRQDGEWAGSWDPDTVWGSYGGRVYTTAMAALTLQVYYRYLPLFERR